MNWSGAKNLVHKKVTAAITYRINHPQENSQKPVSGPMDFVSVCFTNIIQIARLLTMDSGCEKKQVSAGNC